ncbi:MAG: response regulator [Pseudomonadales bacterium]|nr:response regulator [Pseudomonadales bacterium]
MSILIIDDNKENQQQFSAILSAHYTIYCADSGNSGLQLAQQLLPETIVLNIVNPQFDGYAFMNSVKQIALIRNIPIIFLNTDFSETSNAVKGLLLGAFDCLAVPTDNALLMIKVEAAVHSRRQELELQHSKDLACEEAVDILIIDDSPDMVLLLETSLSDAGYQVRSASTGNQGIALAQEVRPQLIILDVLMPGINGFDTCRQLKSMAETELIPVIFVTSENMSCAEEEGFSVGGVDYIMKPINVPLLLARVKIHLQLKLYQDSLEEVVKQRTKELRSSLKKLSQSNEIKDAFLTIINHELRTPLNGAQGALYLMQHDQQLPPEQAELLSTASNSLSDLCDLVESILILTEAIAGTLKLDNKPFSLTKVLNNIVTKARQKSDNRALSFEVKIESDLTDNFIGDPAQLTRVIEHLIDNAVKFTHHGHIKLKSKLDRATKTDNFMILKITVEDTGIGIDNDQLEKIFQLFRQLEDNSTRRFSGLGIGLTFCQSLLQMMKGSIHISSQEDHGTIAKLEIPLQIDKQTNTSIVTSHQPIDISSKTILIVEDNPVNLIVERKFAEKYGLNVVVAGNGEEAIVEIEKTEVDIILMDCQMPVMDGFEATKIIRNAKSSIRKVPIIAVTANSTTLDRERCIESGMDDYIPKPIDLDELTVKLDHWLSL